jgi:hypothetical protein
VSGHEGLVFSRVTHTFSLCGYDPVSERNDFPSHGVLFNIVHIVNIVMHMYFTLLVLVQQNAYAVCCIYCVKLFRSCGEYVLQHVCLLILNGEQTMVPPSLAP